MALAKTPLTETDEKKNDILMFERMDCQCLEIGHNV